MVDYLSDEAPSDYRCVSCLVKGVKLWRESGFGIVSTFCADCAIGREGAVGSVDSQGKISTEWGLTDQIGSLLPAVPTREDDGYWGYSETPAAGVRWWKMLPTRRDSRDGPVRVSPVLLSNDALQKIKDRIKLMSKGYREDVRALFGHIEALMQMNVELQGACVKNMDEVAVLREELTQCNTKISKICLVIEDAREFEVGV